MSAASEVTAWRDLPASVRRALWDEFFREDLGTLDGEAMGSMIHALRQQLTRMACPVCGTVNPPEVHTCTPRATCTAEERAFLDTHSIGAAETRYLMLYRALTPEHQKQVRDYADMLATQHTVKRVALVEET